jgi:dCMP deaminase
VSERDWDKYFLNVCKAVSENSKCLSRKIGVIIVRDRSIISTGYNGPARGIEHCENRNPNKEMACPRRLMGYASRQGMEYCPATHAEVNAIVNTARNGICIKGSTMYMTCPIPCKNCLTNILNSGIIELVVGSMTDYDLLAKELIGQSGIRVREYNI